MIQALKEDEGVETLEVALEVALVVEVMNKEAMESLNGMRKQVRQVIEVDIIEAEAIKMVEEEG